MMWEARWNSQGISAEKEDCKEHADILRELSAATDTAL
jgi:hypothetical protein